MDIPKILRRLLALRRTAKDRANTPEGDNAARHAHAWSAKHGLDLSDESLETDVELVKCEQFWEIELLAYIAHMLELGVHELNGEIRLTGIRAILDEAMMLYEHHQAYLRRVVNFSMVGYLFAAMPEGLAGYREMDRSDFPNDTPSDDASKRRILDREMFEHPSVAEKALVTSAGQAGTNSAKPLWESLKAKVD